MSGSWVVAFSGTLGSTRLLNRFTASVERSDSEDGLVIARLVDALRPGLTGSAYWYTTYRIARSTGRCWAINQSSATCSAPTVNMAPGERRRGGNWRELGRRSIASG